MPGESCADCHFLVREELHLKWPVEFSERRQLRRGDDSWLREAASLSCYHGVWSESAPGHEGSRREIIVETERRGSCFFRAFQPGMLLPAAAVLQEREAAYREASRERRLTIWGLRLAAGSILTTLVGVVLALVLAAAREEAATVTRIRNLMQATRAEIEWSTEVLRAAPKQTDPTLMLGAEWRRIVDNPSGSLHVLVDSATFIERAEPAIVVDLMHLHRSLPHIDYTPPGISTSVNYEARKLFTLARIQLIDELLQIQDQVFEGATSPSEAEEARKRARTAAREGLEKAWAERNRSG